MGDWILVGVDGSEAGVAAVRYAAAEARRRNAALRLVHVVPDFEPAPGWSPVRESPWRREMRRHGAAILAEAEGRARELLSGPAVTPELLTGYRVEALVRASVGACLVVLGDERRSTRERISTVSVLGEVAALAPAPVVAVPADWSPAPGHARVVAAVKDCGDAGGLVRHAIEASYVRDADLVLLHAWGLPPTFDRVIGSDVDPSRRASGAREELEQVLKTVSVPLDVGVRIEVVHGQAAKVLVDASSEADLLVLSRRPRGFPFGRLGGTGRAVLRESHCPVMVLPPAATVVEDVASATSG